MTENQDIQFDVTGPLGIVTLNRPKSLNALTLGMIRTLDPVLADWADDPAVRAVVIRGAGDRAFCAGGDVRAIYDAGKAMKEGSGDGALTRDFFREEYRVNRRIHRFPKPYLALLDGITMGGGVGLSVHGSYRITTERTLFSMPETAIGLFPDVGGTWFLPRCPGETGTYVALTGTRLHAADIHYLGIGTYHVPSGRIDDAVADLAAADLGGADSGREIDRVLARHAVAAGDPPLAGHRAAIDRCFGFDTIEEILAALEHEGTDWAKSTLEILGQVSPTSLKVTLRQIRSGKTLDFDDAMKMEYRLSQGFMRGHDFYEGIRAALIDKDRSPKWRPADLAAVGEGEVEGHFAPLGANELAFGD